MIETISDIQNGQHVERCMGTSIINTHSDTHKSYCTLWDVWACYRNAFALRSHRSRSRRRSLSRRHCWWDWRRYVVAVVGVAAVPAVIVDNKHLYVHSCVHIYIWTYACVCVNFEWSVCAVERCVQIHKPIVSKSRSMYICIYVCMYQVCAYVCTYGIYADFVESLTWNFVQEPPTA